MQHRFAFAKPFPLELSTRQTSPTSREIPDRREEQNGNYKLHTITCMECMKVQVTLFQSESLVQPHLPWVIRWQTQSATPGRRRRSIGSFPITSSRQSGTPQSSEWQPPVPGRNPLAIGRKTRSAALRRRVDGRVLRLTHLRTSFLWRTTLGGQNSHPPNCAAQKLHFR